MSLCINLSCPQPSHPDSGDSRFCQSCGSDLLLQGRYRVMRLLSDSSGFGQVYEVYEQATPKILKVLKVSHNHNPKIVELFRQEALVLSQLKHPGVPKVTEDGYWQFRPRNSTEPLHCILMEKIEGPNLMQWMQQQGNHPISESQALNWLQQLAEILHLVHQKNYFHRDIKPQNVMIRPNGQLVLIDFGAAREMTHTYLAQIGGSGSVTQISSAGYTPPEQEKGHAVPQSDFFALGRTFIYLLTGKQLTDSGVYDSLQDEYHWREYAPGISPQLADFVDRLAASKAVDRPKNTQEILETLTQLRQSLADPNAQLRHQPTDSIVTVVDPPTAANPPTVIKASAKRYSWLVAGVAALVVGVGGYGVWRAYSPQLLQDPEAIAPTEQLSTGKILSGHTSYVNALAISPDGSTLISGSADRTIKIWNLTTGQALRTLTGHTSYVNELAISPDGTTLVSGSADRTIKIWNLTTGKELHTLTGHKGFVNALAISSDGAMLVSGSADRTIKIWDLATGQALRTLTGHTGFINALVIHPDGSTLISGSADRTIKIWDLTTGQELRTLTGHTDFVNGLAITPDGRTLASGSADQTIKLWTLQTGAEQNTLRGHNSYVNALAISSDGRRLMSASADRTLKIWDLTTGQELRTLTGYEYPIDYFAVSASWQILATGSGDQDIQVWYPQKSDRTLGPNKRE